MNLIEEAVIIELFGIRMYAFGLYVALGTLFSVIVLCMAGRSLSLKKGTIPLTAVCSIICGTVVSRITFCLLNRELGQMTPLSFWPELSGGGWSMISDGVELGLDAFVTGSVDEPVQELCREGHITCIALGHYNSEKIGVLALMKLVQKQFGVDVEFIDIANPI